MSDNSNGGSVNYHPRLCHLTKWDDFNGYGFNLHAEKGKAGQYIGKVDDGSPAIAAQLRQGDRIVEVNGVNIGNENHQQVVQRIKAGGEETKLLVVDAETDLYFKEQKTVIRGDMPEVIYCKTPLTSDAVMTEGPVHVNSHHTADTENLNHNEETGEMTQEVKDSVQENDTVHTTASVLNGVNEVAAPIETAEELKENGVAESVPEPDIPSSESDTATSDIAAPELETERELAAPIPEPEPVLPIPEPEPVLPISEPEPTAPMPEPNPVFLATPSELKAEATQPSVPETTERKGDDLLDFGNVSVEEMKKRIQSKKKVDTRFLQIGLKEKYELLQQL